MRLRDRSSLENTIFVQHWTWMLSVIITLREYKYGSFIWKLFCHLVRATHCLNCDRGRRGGGEFERRVTWWEGHRWHGREKNLKTTISQVLRSEIDVLAVMKMNKNEQWCLNLAGWGMSGNRGQEVANEFWRWSKQLITQISPRPLPTTHPPPDPRRDLDKTSITDAQPTENAKTIRKMTQNKTI